MKTCTKCHKEKPPAEFYGHRLGRDGLRAECRECSKSAGRRNARLWYARNRARKRADSAARRATRLAEGVFAPE